MKQILEAEEKGKCCYCLTGGRQYDKDSQLDCHDTPDCGVLYLEKEKEK